MLMRRDSYDLAAVQAMTSQESQQTVLVLTERHGRHLQTRRSCNLFADLRLRRMPLSSVFGIVTATYLQQGYNTVITI